MENKFNQDVHKKFWEFMSKNPQIDINYGLIKAKKNNILTENEFNEFNNAKGCRTGCKYANFICEQCIFDIKDPKLCLGGLYDAYERAQKKFYPIYKTFVKRPELINDYKFMKKFLRMKTRISRLCMRIANHKIKENL